MNYTQTMIIIDTITLCAESEGQSGEEATTKLTEMKEK